MKASFSRAAFNCVEKNVKLRQYVELPSKNILVAFAAIAQKKLWTKQKNLTLPFIVIWPRLFSCLLPLFEKFRRFGKAKDMEWEAYDKVFLLLRLLWVKITILQWRRAGKTLLSLIALRRSVRVKNRIWRKKELLLEKCKSAVLSTLGLQLNWATKSNWGGLDKTNLNWKQE